ncbi:FtsK/SpoIIIE domain-containing protein [Streptococcus canis]|uniref:FtsK/SpoIIIE domain-containing protein n=1 Tax=Streptococcus canis TaxID=1329 RepID=UPI0011440BD3|nr:FtsK/SpoIIIE domain-containing protein [Streptococcus canis]QKG76892.1 cell division protein FtsK [Streptococcus canis]GEE06502.1 transposase [Streptococcus canis]GFG41169.1 transposase [Streptococcus canis]GMX35338.1 FtsK/SpoIIIE domain-containing protein [Streptococcus canis]GMX39211.1 FtsK/SpoIIIE domain-containing protein [Streptococcus canis]
MTLWTYRGTRVRQFHLYLKGITFALFLSPFLVGNVYYHYLQWRNFYDNPIRYGVITFLGLLVSVLIALLVNIICYRYLLFFQFLDNLRVGSRFVFENGYYYSKKGANGKEKIKYPRIYLKRDKFGLDMTFILQGNKFQDRFINLSSSLEIMFDGDFMAKTFQKGFVTYTIILDHIRGRLSIDDVSVDSNGLRLMEDVWWNYDKEPHLLIGGGTGGGKTILLMSILKALLPVGYVDIGDPKKLDLSGLKDIPVFRQRVFSSKEDMIMMLEDNAQLVKKRGHYMSHHKQFTIGKNYAFYGLKPKFVLFDEWAAFMTKIDSGNLKDRDRVMEAITSIVLEGRQAGVFMILAMQRPDGEFIKTSLRDNFTKRISVGHLEDTGYVMMYGDANRNKVFKKIDYINGKRVFARGYVANSGEIAQEFYAPFVPLEDGYSFVGEFSKMDSLEPDDDLYEDYQEEQTNSDNGTTVIPFNGFLINDSNMSDELLGNNEREEETFMKQSPEGKLYMEELAQAIGQTGSKIRKLIKLIQDGAYRDFDQDSDGRYVFDYSDIEYFSDLYTKYESYLGTWKQMLEEELSE